MTQKAILITVRSGSTRLPNKALLEINGKATIEFLIERAKKSSLADKIILCTTVLKEDLALVELAKKHGIDYFCGSVEDKLERWQGACDQFGIDYFVTADGDDLFCEPELMDLAFQQFQENQADFIEGKDIVFGAFSFAIKTAALNIVCDIKDTNDTEMMWVYFKETGRFKTEILKNVPSLYERPDIRMTLDYQDDFNFFQNIIHHFGENELTLKNIIHYLDENPEVIKINQYLHDTWLENQKSKTTLKLKEVGLNEESK